MKTKSNFIKKWAKSGGNQRGENYILKPRDKRKHSLKDIPNLQADEVNVIAIIGPQNSGQRKTICTVAELEQLPDWIHIDEEPDEIRRSPS